MQDLLERLVAAEKKLQGFGGQNSQILSKLKTV
jgi:hypothetical protein